MKDAESYKVLMFLNRPSHLRPWWPDKHPDSILGWHSVEGLHLARGCTLMEDIPSQSLSQSVVCRQMDWERGSYCMASQVTTFDSFRFLSLGLHKGLDVPNEGASCG
jgi:hypothetical protein